MICRYPPFPEVIAFGKDRRNSGIGCHHPKLLVLQREDSIRVVITSANLGSKQVIFTILHNCYVLICEIGGEESVVSISICFYDVPAVWMVEWKSDCLGPASVHEIILDHRACVEFCVRSPVKALVHINIIILLIVYFFIYNFID